MDREAWQATVQGGLKESNTTDHTHTQPGRLSPFKLL